LDLFTTYTHYSELHVITALSLICTLQFTVIHTLRFSVFTSHILATDFNTVIIPISHVKSSLHRLTFKSQLNSLPPLLIHLRLQSQENPSIILLVGPGSSLYSFGADPTENIVSIVIAQQDLDCCLFTTCRRNLFTEPLPSNERLFWLLYSGFQASCHNVTTQILLVLHVN
jgi:hypothetical protein